MGRIIEGVWDCTYCDAKKIRGSIYKCPCCGRPRDDDITFYIDNPKNYISDEEAEKLNKNPDWLCSFCDSLNADDNETCFQCGASKKDSELNYFENKKKKAQEMQEQLIREQGTYSFDENRYESSAKNTRDKVWEEDSVFGKEDEYRPNNYANNFDNNEELVSEDYRESYRSTTSKRNINWGGIIKVSAITLAVILAIVGMIWIFSPKTEMVTIDSFGWERSIEIEEYKTVKESDWSVPNGGRVYDENIEIKTYVQVLDHYETKTRTWTEQVIDHYETYVSGYRDLGNGRFEEITSQRPVYKTVTKSETYQEPVYRNDPVYATKYYYEIERWLHKNYEKTSGSDKSPYWSTYSLKEKEREGTRSEKYIVYITNEDGNKKEYTLSFDEWNVLQQGQKLKLKVYFGGSAEIIWE